VTPNEYKEKLAAFLAILNAEFYGDSSSHVKGGDQGRRNSTHIRMIDLKNFMFIVENGKAQGKPAYITYS
jgi:hypothetical protein